MKKLLLIALMSSICMSAQITLGGKNGNIFINPTKRNTNKRISSVIQYFPSSTGGVLNIGGGNGIFSIRKKLEVSEILGVKKDTVKPKNNVFYEGKSREYE